MSSIAILEDFQDASEQLRRACDDTRVLLRTALGISCQNSGVVERHDISKEQYNEEWELLARLAPGCRKAIYFEPGVCHIMELDDPQTEIYSDKIFVVSSDTGIAELIEDIAQFLSADDLNMLHECIEDAVKACMKEDLRRLDCIISVSDELSEVSLIAQELADHMRRILSMVTEPTDSNDIDAVLAAAQDGSELQLRQHTQRVINQQDDDTEDSYSPNTRGGSCLLGSRVFDQAQQSSPDDRDASTLENEFDQPTATAAELSVNSAMSSEGSSMVRVDLGKGSVSIEAPSLSPVAVVRRSPRNSIGSGLQPRDSTTTSAKNTR
jgi:hypothetical protein